MRADIQEIFKLTPHDKQVMMFSATLSQDMRAVCKKFMSNVRIGFCQSDAFFLMRLGIQHCWFWNSSQNSLLQLRT